MRFAVSNPSQFNITLDPDLKKRLEELALEFKMGKATKVGAKIIETYIERWARIQRRKEEWENEQEREMLERIEREIGRPVLVRGEAGHKSTGRIKRR